MLSVYNEGAGKRDEGQEGIPSFLILFYVVWQDPDDDGAGIGLLPMGKSKSDDSGASEQPVAAQDEVKEEDDGEPMVQIKTRR